MTLRMAQLLDHVEKPVPTEALPREHFDAGGPSMDRGPSRKPPLSEPGVMARRKSGGEFEKTPCPRVDVREARLSLWRPVRAARQRALEHSGAPAGGLAQGTGRKAGRTGRRLGRSKLMSARIENGAGIGQPASRGMGFPVSHEGPRTKKTWKRGPSIPYFMTIGPAVDRLRRIEAIAGREHEVMRNDVAKFVVGDGRQLHPRSRRHRADIAEIEVAVAEVLRELGRHVVADGLHREPRQSWSASDLAKGKTGASNGEETGVTDALEFYICENRCRPDVGVIPRQVVIST